MKTSRASPENRDLPFFHVYESILAEVGAPQFIGGASVICVTQHLFSFTKFVESLCWICYHKIIKEN